MGSWSGFVFSLLYFKDESEGEEREDERLEDELHRVGRRGFKRTREEEKKSSVKDGFPEVQKIQGNGTEMILCDM